MRVLECGVFVVILWWMVYRRWFLETTLRGAENFPLFRDLFFEWVKKEQATAKANTGVLRCAQDNDV
jgi:hypothetical protein